MAISINVNGSLDGYEESKSYPGRYYVYIRPTALPPTGMLRMVKCEKGFGAPADAVQKLGVFAILCEPESIPSAQIGDRVSCNVTCWPVSKPVWSDRLNNISQAKDTEFFYVLNGEIKSSTSKPTPAAYTAQAFYAGAVKDDRGISVRMVIDDQPPAWLLREQRIKKGKQNNFVTGTDMVAKLVVIAEEMHMGNVQPNSLIESKGVCWPICHPYWDRKTEQIIWQKIPSPIFLTNHAITQDKAKPAAAVTIS